MPKHVVLGHKVKFQGTAADPYPGGSITGFSWTAEHGHKTTSGSRSTFSLKVKKPGRYVVTLKVTDSYGFTGTTTTTSTEEALTPSRRGRARGSATAGPLCIA